MSDVVAEYEFWIEVTSSTTVWYSEKLTLDVVCGSSSAIITPSAYTADQTKDSASGFEYYEFPVFTSSVAACSSFTY